MGIWLEVVGKEVAGEADPVYPEHCGEPGAFGRCSGEVVCYDGVEHGCGVEWDELVRD